MHVSFAPAVPVDKPLVVGTKPSTRALYAMLLACVVLEVALAAAVVGLAIWSAQPLFLAVLPLLALQVWLMLRVIREYQGLLGPQLAADHTGVWVRTGLGPRPETVYLPWPAVDGLDAMPKGPVLRIMSHAGDALFPPRPHWRARSLRRRFGTPFIVDGKRSAVHPTELAARLHAFRR